MLVILLMFYFLSKKEDELELKGRYTIGEIQNIYPVRGYFNVKFSYKINNKNFESVNNINKNENAKIGLMFFVKFSPDNPKNSKILLDYLVPNNIKEVPKNGWEKIPDDSDLPR